MALTNARVFVALLCSAVLVTFVAAQEKNAPTASELECLKELGIDGKDTKIDNEATAMKMVTCVMKKDGVITEDGQFKAEKAIEVMMRPITDEKLKEKGTAVVTACEKEINSTKRPEEETIKMVLECLQNAGRAMIPETH